MAELLPCPFCGTIEGLSPSYDWPGGGKPKAIDCVGCGMDFVPREGTDVIAHWNRRAGISPKLYLDLDGVMANFDAHFPALFGADHRGMLDDDMWAKINSHPSYFRDMPIFDGAAAFFKKIEWLDPIILTACPKSNYAHAARQKRAWVREHLSTSCIILPVMGGRNKPLFMHAPGDVLIDDFPKNIEAWRDEGGVGILHKGDFDENHDALIDVLDKRGLLP